MSDVPHLRFPEFCGEWVETTLGKISEITKGSGISKDQLSEQGSPCILYGELYTKYKSEIINEVYSRTELEPSSLVKSMANDVIIPCSGETAIDISTARCVPFDNILLGGDLNIIRLKNDDGGFFAYQLNGTRKKDIARVAQGVSVVHLYGENLKQIRVYYPNTEEQKKITRLLSLIDERIATQNKIIEKLESLIKGLSQRLLFPKQGWTSYRLDELCQIKSGFSGTQVSLQTAYKVSRIETISKHCIDMSRTGYVKDIPQEYKLNAGDILFSNINSVQYIGNTAFIDKDYGLYHGMNLLRIIPNSNIVFPRFIHLLLCTDRLLRHFQSVCNKAVSQASINQTSLGKTIMSIPSYGEQQHICRIIGAVEHKLDIETNLLETLQHQKHYLLRQMFI
jgi:type I restriction enzyme S subunit